MDPKILASRYEAQLIADRRWLHRHAELSFQEQETADYLRGALAQLGLPLMPGIRGNSTVAVLDTGRPGKTLAFRADIDALNLQETGDCAFASEHDGCMHACGHDGHAAILLNLARALKSEEPNLCGKLLFVFQQGEERQPGGAKLLCEDGAMQGVDFIAGLHMDPTHEVGTIASVVGPESASVDDFQLLIHGHGGHGARPHLAKDPILCGVSVCNELQQVVARFHDPLQPLVISVCKFSGGYARNVIPEEVELLATVRHYDEGLRAAVEQRIREVVDSVCRLHGCTYDLVYEHGYPALVNPEEGVQRLRRVVSALGYQNAPGEVSMGAEDFSYYLREVPGVYYQLGCGHVGESRLHNPNFRIDERCLPIGLTCMLALCEDLMSDSSRN